MRTAPPWIVIAGPTGTGKSELAVRIAERIGGEVVNADSVQVYRGFDIGSAKPSVETRSLVPHHLFDRVSPDSSFDAAQFAQLAREACRAIEDRGNRPVLVGGTGFYLRSLLRGLPEMPPADEMTRARLRRLHATPRGRAHLHRWLRKVDPISAERISMNDRHRLERALEVWIRSGRPISANPSPQSAASVQPAIVLALRLERDLLIEKLDRRVDQMYEAGLVEETRDLLERYPSTARPFGAIGYAEAVKVVEGTMTVEEAAAETRRRTRAYAKRQMTWFRGERDVHWLDAAQPPDELLQRSLEIIHGEDSRPS